MLLVPTARANITRLAWSEPGGGTVLVTGLVADADPRGSFGLLCKVVQRFAGLSKDRKRRANRISDHDR